MTDASAVTRLEVWRRRIDRWMMILPYGALVAATALVPIGAAADVPHEPYGLIIPLVLATAAWLAWWVTLHPQWEQDRRRMRIFFVGLLALIYLLVWCSPLFGFFAWTGYVLTPYALRTRKTRLAGATLVAIGTAASQAGG